MTGNGYDLDRIDAELVDVAARQPVVDYADPLMARARLARALKLSRSLRPGTTSGVKVSDRLLSIAEGSRPIACRIYEPTRREAPVPALLFFHGGAFVAGTLETEDARCREYVRRAGIVVLSVDYRLAPEHPYPAGFDDCYDSLVWLSRSAHHLGVDPARIAVGGSSAGGALAAAVALAARDRGHADIALQLLLYPVIDDRLATWSMSQFVATPGWNRPNSVHMWRHYLRAHDGEVPPYAAPARATDLSGLPPAYVMTADRDPLRDEGIDYAVRLVAADVTTEIHNFPGAFHGFDSAAPSARLSQRAMAEQCAVLTRGVELTGTATRPAPERLQEPTVGTGR